MWKEVLNLNTTTPSPTTLSSNNKSLIPSIQSTLPKTDFSFPQHYQLRIAYV
jgi:hypothetical protein